MEPGAGEAFIHCTALHCTTVMISPSSSRVPWEGGRQETRDQARERRDFKEIAGTATRECFGQSEVADTTDGCALAI